MRRFLQKVSLAIGVLAFIFLGVVEQSFGIDYATVDLGRDSIPSGINNAGQVAGNTAGHAFLYSGGVMTDLGNTRAIGINDQGQVVGGSTSNWHAFLYSGGVMTDLGTLGGQSVAYGINDQGQVVGWSNVAAGTLAFLYSGGVMTDLGTLGGTISDATGINSSGQVVGASRIAGNTAEHAFLYSGGVMTDLGTLGGSTSRAYGINDQGQVVGVSTIAGNTAEHAFLYSGGVMTDLGTLGGGNSRAYGINDQGQVVGESNGHAFLYSGGVMTDLNTLLPVGSAWTLTRANAINDQGQIVGEGNLDRLGTYAFSPHGFLMGPVSTPPRAGVRTWGNNYYGELGDPTRRFSLTPVPVAGVDNVVAVAGGAGHTIALKSDGTVWTWGLMQYCRGIIGTTTSPAPVPMTGLDSVVAIAGGGCHATALKSDGTVWTWGYNGYGQLGDGTTANRFTPVQVAGVDNVVAIAGGSDHTIALKSDGKVWTWGHNYCGALGDGTQTDRYSPVQVAGVDNVVAIAGGGAHTIALKSDGTVWAWGDNHMGQIGVADWPTLFRPTPAQVAGVDNVVAIAGGDSHTMALKSDGTVWAWGDNSVGQLGDGTTTRTYTPVPVIGLSGVSAIAGGVNHSLAIKSDGSAWAWGSNDIGQLGDGTRTNKSAPVEVIGLTGVVAIAGGYQHTVALTGDRVSAIVIDSGAGFTTSPSVTVTLTCPNPGADCSYMQFSNDNSYWSSPEVFSTSREWTLTSGDGTKIVYVKFQDASGTWSGAFSDTIIFDTTPSTTTASPASGVYNGSVYVTLTCNDGAGSGCGKIYYTLSGLTPTTSSSVYSGPISISSNTTLGFFAVDRAGNMGAVRTEVYTINSTLPPTGWVMINDNAALTNSASVTLTMNRNAPLPPVACVAVYPSLCGVTEMMFSNDGLTWTAPEAAATPRQWTLTSGDETKIVYVKIKDISGTWSGAFSDTIILDTAAPTTTASPSGGLYNGSVSVTLVCADATGSGCDRIYYTVDGSTPSTSSPVYTAPVTISSNTTLNFLALDLAGNQEPVQTQVYTIDATPPTGSVVINAGAGLTNSVSVVLTLSCIDPGSGCAEMQLSNDNMNWTTPEAYATTKAWTLVSGDGSKTVFARFKDNAGNWSVTCDDSIVLSTAKADLRISSLLVPETGTAGRPITVTDTTRNAGPGAAAASTTRFYLSKDPSLSARDVLLGSRSVLALSVGQSATGTTAVTIPRTTEAGNYYILAVSDGDNAVSEVNESNNIRYRSIRIKD